VLLHHTKDALNCISESYVLQIKQLFMIMGPVIDDVKIKKDREY
jgi:hypothetical protein